MYISAGVFSCVLMLDIAVKTKSSSFKYLCLIVACQRSDCVFFFNLNWWEDYIVRDYFHTWMDESQGRIFVFISMGCLMCKSHVVSSFCVGEPPDNMLSAKTTRLVHKCVT